MFQVIGIWMDKKKWQGTCLFLQKIDKQNQRVICWQVPRKKNNTKLFSYCLRSPVQMSVSNFGPTWVTMVLWPTWFGLLQHDIRNPPHPPSTTPPCNQQNRKNSQEPVMHWLWSPTKNLSLGGGLLRLVGRVKKNLSCVFHWSGRGPPLKSSLLTRAEAAGRYSLNMSSSSLKKSPKSSLLSWLLSGRASANPTPMVSRRSWSLSTLKPRSKDKSCWVKWSEWGGLGLGLGLGLGEGPGSEPEWVWVTRAVRQRICGPKEPPSMVRWRPAQSCSAIWNRIISNLMDSVFRKRGIFGMFDSGVAWRWLLSLLPAACSSLGCVSGARLSVTPIIRYATLWPTLHQLVSALHSTASLGRDQATGRSADLHIRLQDKWSMLTVWQF